MTDIINTIIETLSAFPSIEQVILFGSRARDDYQERSDIDIAINCPSATEQDWITMWDTINQLDTLLQIDLVRFDSASDELRAKIIKQGKVLFECEKS